MTRRDDGARRPFVVAIIAAGGRGSRMGADVPKQLLEVGGRSIVERSLAAFLEHDSIDEVVLVVPAGVHIPTPPGGTRKRVQVVAGGARRQDSVARGFDAVPGRADIVVVHDAARPFVSGALIQATIDAAVQTGAALAALPVHDTVKLAADSPADRAVAGEEPVIVERTIPRERVHLAQTPQAFRREVLAAAVAAGRAGREATDEALLAELCGHPVRLVPGEPGNVKITTMEDLEMARARAASHASLRVGIGYDLHRLVEGRPLVLGGVTIPFDRGLDGHSDADAIAHALIDAVLGAAGQGDIGRLFPDTDQRWRGASSLDLLTRAVAVVRAAGCRVVNVDLVVIAERPKLAPHLDAMRQALAGPLGVDAGRISIKGKTNEGTGEIGGGEAIAVHAVALVSCQD